jgi:2-polyprenyl-3-methyl-5-hydroxy-6-metoxy-1,4-benzoquinol methylase
MKKTKNIDKKSTSWSPINTWYDQYVGEEGSPFHQHVIFPGIARLVNVQKPLTSPMHWLDLACGQGVLQRTFTDPMMHHVGIDLSQELIQTAQQRNTSPNVRYFVGDATQLLQENGQCVLPLQPHAFDVITLVLAIQNMSHLSPVWRAAKTLLKPKGKLVIVMMHPNFRIPKASDWQWNEKDHRQERVLWSYLSSQEIPILANPGNPKSQTMTPHFHRPLQAYINTLGNAGLYVDHLEEWVSHVGEQASDKSAALLKAKKEFPMFMAIRAINVD